MIKIAALNKSEREELFLNTSEKAGLPPSIIEKDFWVCYMLDYLFHRCRWKEKFVFKGGTSLSKAYHLIKRFSEDIYLESADEPTVSFAYPQIFSKKKTMIRTAIPERTFWEKVTILHREANRKQGNLENLTEDYVKMRKMLYGTIPEFEVIMNKIRDLEQEINGIIR